MYFQKTSPLMVLQLLIILLHGSNAVVHQKHKGVKYQSLHNRLSKNIIMQQLQSTIVTTDLEIKSKHITKRQLQASTMLTEREIKSKKCTQMQKESIILDCVSNGLNSLGSSMGPFSFLFAGVATLTYISKSKTDIHYIDLGCDDIPFDEIKDILNTRFQKIDNALDRNYGALKEISSLVYKTLESLQSIKTEMREAFVHTNFAIKDVNKKISINNVIHFTKNFERNRLYIEMLSEKDYIKQIKNIKEVINKLSGVKSATVNDLVTYLTVIIDHSYDIPQREDDKVALTSLDTLYKGMVIYYKLILFLISQTSYIANYYYERDMLDDYNEYHNYISSDFKFLKYNVMNNENTSLINTIINHFDIVRNNTFVRNDVSLVKTLSDQKQTLIDIKRTVEQIELPILDLEPDKIRHIRFDTSQTRKPLGRWNGSEYVRYALQYKVDKSYSQIGPWSNPIKTMNKAYPIITLPASKNVSMLVFRKIENDTPEFVGTAKGKQFMDIDRDLYDAILDDNENEAIETVTTLMKYGAKVDTALDKGQTAIHLAAMYNKIKLAKKCLVDNVEHLNIRDNNGFTAMHIAFRERHFDFLKMLIEKGADVNIKTHKEELTLLHMATDACNVDVIRILRKLPNLDVNAKDKKGYTSLHKAVYTNVEVAQELLSHPNINVNVKANDDFTPLLLAVAQNKFPIINKLLERGDLKINAGNKGNLTALHLATMAGYTDTVKTLIQMKGIDVNMRSIDGRTALHYAIGLKKIDIVTFLLNDTRINMNIGDKSNITPLHAAVMTGQDDIVFKLVEHGVNINEPTKDGFTALHFFCLRNKQNNVLTLLLFYHPLMTSDINAKTKDGMTPLHFAVTHSSLDVIKTLIKWGANVNVTDNTGKSLLHHAAAHGKLAVVQYLLETVNLNYAAVDKFDKRPLDLALLNKQFKVVKYFSIKAGNSFKNFTILDGIRTNNIAMIEYLIQNRNQNKLQYLNQENRYRETPLFDAVKYGRLNIVKYMIKNGAKLNVRDDYDQHPIHIAAKHGHLDIVKYFIEEERCDVNIKTKSVGTTTLHYAVQSGNLDLVKYLIDRKGANPEVKDGNGFTPLHYSVTCALDTDSERRMNVVKYLVEEKRVDSVAEDSNGRTPFYVAAEYGNLEASIYLSSLYEKFGIHTYNNVRTIKEGNTPLIAAAENGHLNVVKWLVESQIINFRDSDYVTAYYHALSNNRYDIVYYICYTGKKYLYDRIFCRLYNGPYYRMSNRLPMHLSDYHTRQNATVAR